MTLISEWVRRLSLDEDAPFPSDIARAHKAVREIRENMACTKEGADRCVGICRCKFPDDPDDAWRTPFDDGWDDE